MTHIIQVAHDVSFLLCCIIGLMVLAVAAFLVLDRIVTRLIQYIGLWPYITDAIWKYCRERREREERASAEKERG